MEALISVIALIFVIILVQRAFASRRVKPRPPREAPVYQYGRKEYIMTKAEHNFFLLLRQACGDRYDVFPQVHLSSILDGSLVKGQNWDAAFKHINGKSVDYVICDKQFAKPIIAIELDDWSHDSNIRHTRDTEVERIFTSANLPLVRFSDYKSLTMADIETKLSQAFETNDKSG